MSWPPDIAEDLPNPHEDDPPSLRVDILDELADHLSCAFTRELHFTADESRAKENVLDRFGNPAQIARKLWFDALKEKVMTQRLNLVLSSLMTAACLAAVVVSWQMMREGREVNNALLAAIKELADRPAPIAAETPKSMDWNPVKIKLVLEKKGGAPAVGYKASLTGNVYAENFGEIDIVSDENGLADFGLVRFGKHSLAINAPWGANYSEMISVRPGAALTKEIICPARELKETEVSCRIEWPENWPKALGLPEKGIWALCSFSQETRQFSDGATWIEQPQRRNLIVREDGKLFAFLGEVPSYSITLPQAGPSQTASYFQLDGVMNYFLGEAMEWPATHYDLTRLAILFVAEDQLESRSPPISLPKSALMLGEVVFTSPFHDTSHLLAGIDFASGFGRGGLFMVPPEARSNRAPRFEAQPGKANRWSIPLPPPLVSALEEKAPFTTFIMKLPPPLGRPSPPIDPVE